MGEGPPNKVFLNSFLSLIRKGRGRETVFWTVPFTEPPKREFDPQNRKRWGFLAVVRLRSVPTLEAEEAEQPRRCSRGSAAPAAALRPGAPRFSGHVLQQEPEAPS